MAQSTEPRLPVTSGGTCRRSWRTSADLPVVGYFDPFASGACGAARSSTSILNVDAVLPTVSCGGALPSSFEDPVHMYNAFELTLNRRLAGNWSAIASYRVQPARRQLRGILPLGQRPVRSGDHLALRLSDQRPDLHGSTATIHGGAGDIRYQGDSLGTRRAAERSAAPVEAVRQLRIWGNFNLGFGFNAVSGTALTALAGNPAYANAGEIPLTRTRRGNRHHRRLHDAGLP